MAERPSSGAPERGSERRFALRRHRRTSSNSEREFAHASALQPRRMAGLVRLHRSKGGFYERPECAALSWRPFISNLDRLRDGQRIFESDAEVAHCAVPLRMAQQKLDRAEVAGFAIYLCHLRSPHGMGTIGARLETDRGHPLAHQTSILPRRNVQTIIKAARPQMFRPNHHGILEPSRGGTSRSLGNFEADRFPGFALDD